jgi:hypothetical protein
MMLIQQCFSRSSLLRAFAIERIELTGETANKDTWRIATRERR